MNEILRKMHLKFKTWAVNVVHRNSLPFWQSRGFLSLWSTESIKYNWKVFLQPKYMAGWQKKNQFSLFLYMNMLLFWRGHKFKNRFCECDFHMFLSACGFCNCDLHMSSILSGCRSLVTANSLRAASCIWTLACSTAAFSIWIKCSLKDFLVTGGGRFILAQKSVNPAWPSFWEANTDLLLTSCAPPPTPPSFLLVFKSVSWLQIEHFRKRHSASPSVW